MDFKQCCYRTAINMLVRIHFRRLASCSAFLLCAVALMSFLQVSLTLFRPAASLSGTMTERQRRLAQLEVDMLDHQPRVQVINDDKEEDGDINDRFNPGIIPVYVGALGSEELTKPKKIFNQAFQVTEQKDEIGHVNVTSQYHVHDWDRDFKSKYFRDDKLPDDVLAVTPPVFLPDFKNPCFYVLDPSGGVILSGGERVALRCLPYFQLIGVDKSGTTDLWFRLTGHKDIVHNGGVLGKETHWFSWRRFGFDIWVRNRPILHFNWYLDNFNSAAEYIADRTEMQDGNPYHPVVTGEGSPTVFWDMTGWNLMPQNAGRSPEEALTTPHCIHHLTPQVKLLLMLRDPVERMFSEYLFLDRFKSKHNISAPLFHEAVKTSIAMYSDCVRVHRSATACLFNKTLHMNLPVRIMVGMYAVWLEEWFKVFPKEQLLILRNEDYSKDLSGHLAHVFRFLQLPPLSEDEMQKVVDRKRAFGRSESEKAVGDMLPETRQMLRDFYDPHNKQLAALLNDNRYLWL